MGKERLRIETHGDYSPGVVKGDYKVYLQAARKLIHAYNDVMEIEDERGNNLLDWPILKDLRSGKKSEVYIDEETIAAIDQILTAPNSRRILLRGAGGRGKTVLSRLLAYRKHNDDWGVYFIDMREIETPDLQGLIDQLHSIAKNSSNPTLFIIENAHLSDENTEKLVNIANYLTKSAQKPRCHFLFNSRDFVRDEDIDPFQQWKKRELCFEVKPDETLIVNIIDQHLDANNKQYQLSQLDREWIRLNILPIENVDTNLVGGNLRLLRLYLIAWNYRNCNLYELSESDVIASLKRFLLVDELSRDVALASLLGKVSSIFQFDVPFYSRRASYSDSKNYVKDLEELRSRGTIKYIGKDFYTLTHSLDAYYVSKCLASYDLETHEGFTAKNIREYISELPKSPVNSIVENLLKLFKALYSDDQQGFEQKVFVSIYSEGREQIKELIIRYYEGVGIPSQKYHEGLGILIRILDLIEMYLGVDEAFEFWEKLYSEISEDSWKRILQRNRPFYIVLLIRSIRRIAPNEEVAVAHLSFILTGFNYIYEKSDLHRLSELFKHLPDSIVSRLTKQIDAPSFAYKIMDSKLIYFEFIIKRLDSSFFKQVFSFIEQNEWDSFVEYVRRDKHRYPKSLLSRIGTVDKDFEKRLRSELKSHFEHIRNKEENRRRSPDGRLLITNKIANNYSSRGLSYTNFREHLSSNFEENFIITVDKIKILRRLITKIVKSTHGYPEWEQGSRIVEQIIYQVSDDLLREVCLDLELLDLIDMASWQAYNYVGKRCKDLY